MSPKRKGITSPIQLGGLTEACTGLLVCRAAAYPPPRPRTAPAPLRGPPVCAGRSPWASDKKQMHVPGQKPGRHHARLHCRTALALEINQHLLALPTCGQCMPAHAATRVLTHAKLGWVRPTCSQHGPHALSSSQCLHALKPVRPASARVSAARPYSDAHLRFYSPKPRHSASRCLACSSQ